MRLTIPMLVLAAALAPAGCDRIARKFAPPEKYVPPERPNDSCDSAPFREYLGQPSEALAGVFIPEPYRIVEDGAPVTMDYNPVRLNLVLGPDGTLVDLYCG